jgi:hypothetical protein
MKFGPYDIKPRATGTQDVLLGTQHVAEKVLRNGASQKKHQ